MSSVKEALPAGLQEAGAASPATPPRPLRSRLFLLAASGLVPLALGLVFAVGFLAQTRRADTERSAIELSRALASALDAELRSTISLLQNLASATDLQDEPPAELGPSAFAGQARRIAASQGWQVVTVLDPRGQLLLRIGASQSMPLAAADERASVDRAIETRQPVVGTMARGPGGREAFAVRVPVLKDGELRYVVSAAVPSTRVLDLVSRQQVAPSWVVGAFDQGGFPVARSRPTSATRYSPTLERLVSQDGREGAGRTTTLEGIETVTGFSRVPTSNWVVATGIPLSEANADLYRLLAALGGGMAASLGLLAWLAWRAAHGIAAPFARLKDAAGRLSTGEEVRVPVLGVTELDEVGAALQRAANELHESDHRRARIEAEREELLARVEEALKAAELANRRKDEFLALLGHELRNPLAPITNALHLMELKGDPASARERAVIHRQLSYVTRLVDDLLDAARISSGRLVMNMQPLHATRVLEQTAEAMRPSLGRRTLRLEIEPAARDAWVKADEARLVQVLNNLLGNAAKFTAAEGHITLSARLAEGGIEMTVTDNGVGMTAAEVARAFDIFYQAPGTGRGVHGGLGLGLAIVRSLIEMHGGSVTARSDGPGQGTAVTVWLPVIEPARPADPAARAHAPASAARVLVCDDNEDAATTLAALLEASGYVAEAVFSPETALARFGAFAPAVAILDIGLPGMDGYELAARLRALPGGERCKFVALTGYGQEGDVKKAFTAGFDAHLTKPADPDVLLRLLGGFVQPGGVTAG